MRLKDELAEGILVARDPARRVVEVQIGAAAANGARTVHLTPVEARRVAALILFETARLERRAACQAAPR
jgi:hypothetical protein